MEKRLIALLSLATLVVLAGCIGIGQEEGIKAGKASGLIIKSFGPDLAEVFSGDSVTFTALLENIGEDDATSVTVKLYGLGTDWTITDAVQTIGDLSKADSSMDIPGGQDAVTWDTISPSNLKVNKNYEAKVRVAYSYGTSGLGSIRVYDKGYLATLPPDEAQTIYRSSGLESWLVTNGPVDIDVAGAARPYIVETDKALTATFTLLLGNEGQGYPYKTSVGDRKVTIDSIKVNDVDCDNWADIAKDPTIPRTGQKSVSCKFTIAANTVVDFKTVPIEVELSYKYYLDASGTVKVLKALS